MAHRDHVLKFHHGAIILHISNVSALGLEILSLIWEEVHLNAIGQLHRDGKPKGPIQLTFGFAIWLLSPSHGCIFVYFLKWCM